MVGMVQITVEKRTSMLCVIHNPYVKGDLRKPSEMWSKGWLKDDIKNKKWIDEIIKGYGT